MRDGGGRLCRCVLVFRLRSSLAAILRALRRSWKVRESRNLAKGQIFPSRGDYYDKRKVEPAVAGGATDGGGGLGGRRRWRRPGWAIEEREREPKDLSLNERERLREIEREPEKPRWENWREKRNLGKIGIFPCLIGLPRIPSWQPSCPDSEVLI